MRRPLFALPLLLAASCETAPEPYAPVQSVHYQAIGAEPFWLLTVGDDRIVLRTADSSEGFIFPRTLPRVVDGVRIWQSGHVPSIIVEARPGPCAGAGGRVYEDQVRIALRTDRFTSSGIEDYREELSGCGGRVTGP